MSGPSTMDWWPKRNADAVWPTGFGAWFDQVKDEYAKVGMHGLDAGDWFDAFAFGVSPRDAVLADLHGLPLVEREAA